MINDILVILAVVGLGAGACWLIVRGYPKVERGYLWAGFLAHVLGCLAQCYVMLETYGGTTDALGYANAGGRLAARVHEGVDGAFGSILALIAQRNVPTPFPIQGAGSATGTMAGLTGLVMVAVGPSFIATSMAFALFSLTGKFALYRAFRGMFAPELRSRVALATLLVPSMVFWTAGIVKEAVALAGMGFACLALVNPSKSTVASRVALASFGLMLVTITKPYLMIGCFAGGAAWVYWSRALIRAKDGPVRIRPITSLLAIAAGIGGILVFQRFFPEFSLEAVAETSANRDELWRRTGGGSNFELGNSTQRSVAGQLAYAPIALLSAMFRPFFFEVRGVTAAISAVETTTLSLVVARVFIYRSWSAIWATVRASAALVMCLVVVVTIGTMVGLTTANMGSLSRYRVPMVPFLAMLALVLARATPRRRAPPPSTTDKFRGGFD